MENNNGADRYLVECYQLLWEICYKTIRNDRAGLELQDYGTQKRYEGRLISNIVLKSDLFDMPVVSFENHGGRTFIGNNQPLGKVLYGAGNDGQTGYEGVVYKNVIERIFTDLFLPKNPQLADWLITQASDGKYGESLQLNR